MARGRYLTFIDDGGWEYVIRPQVTGIVVIVAVTDDDRVLLVEQWRPAVRKRVIELLVLACLVVGIVPALAVGPILNAAARPVVGGTLPEFSLAVWHGFTTPLMMSLVALAGGLLVYRRLASGHILGKIVLIP